MNTRRILLLVVWALALSGCKSGKQNQELLERELRFQEDQIYELENALDQCESELECARREAQSARDGAPPNARKGPLGGRSKLPIIDLPSGPARNLPSEEPTLPTVEPGEEFNPGQSDPGPPSMPGASNQREPGDRRIARIVLNKQMTGSMGSRGAGGEDGIHVVFEPRNARGEMVSEPGDVSIAVVDPERSGPEARIARWDFAASQAFEQFHRSGKAARGYEFELPWPDAAPPNKRLQLFVRYVTPDGRKLLSEMTINVTPSAVGQAKRWRPAEGSMAGRGSNDDAPAETTAQSQRSRRWFNSSNPDRGQRDSEAPRYAGSDAPSKPSGDADLPSVELGQESEANVSAGPPAASDEDDPPALARRPAPVRQARRPAWTPYR